jgi:hypothetical protein
MASRSTRLATSTWLIETTRGSASSVPEPPQGQQQVEPRVVTWGLGGPEPARRRPPGPKPIALCTSLSACCGTRFPGDLARMRPPAARAYCRGPRFASPTAGPPLRRSLVYTRIRTLEQRARRRWSWSWSFAGLTAVRQVYPITLGANLGTTITALLANTPIGPRTLNYPPCQITNL